MDKGELDARLEIRVSGDLLARVDAVRGIASRGAWVRREMERGLARQDLPEPPLSTSAGRSALYERMAPVVEQESEPFYDDGETPGG